MIQFKALETEEGRRDYYTYDPNDPSTLCHHQEPYLDPRFNQQLLDVFGTDSHGDPRFRIVWAGSLRALSFKIVKIPQGPGKDPLADVIEYDGMKYAYMRLLTTTGYEFLDLEGHRVFTKKQEWIPKDAVFTEVAEYDDLGIMKFAIEAKFTAEEMVQLGKYPKPGTPEEDTWCVQNGKRFRSKPSPTGEYVFCHWVETEDGQFSDVTQDLIDRIIYIYNRAATETEPEYVARKLKDREALARKEEQVKELNYRDHVENAIIRAEKRHARGNILYSIR